MDETLRELRRVLERGPAGRHGFPSEVRLQAAAWARQRQATGAPMRALAAELGVSHETLRRWVSHGVSTFRSVRVADASPLAPEGGIVLRLPNGAAIEGLRVEDVIVVLRALS